MTFHVPSPRESILALQLSSVPLAVHPGGQFTPMLSLGTLAPMSVTLKEGDVTVYVHLSTRDTVRQPMLS